MSFKYQIVYKYKEMKAETDKPILIVLNKNKPNELHLSLDQRVINFNLHPI